MYRFRDLQCVREDEADILLDLLFLIGVVPTSHEEVQSPKKSSQTKLNILKTIRTSGIKLHTDNISQYMLNE